MYIYHYIDSTTQLALNQHQLMLDTFDRDREKDFYYNCLKHDKIYHFVTFPIKFGDIDGTFLFAMGGYGPDDEVNDDDDSVDDNDNDSNEYIHFDRWCDYALYRNENDQLRNDKGELDFVPAPYKETRCYKRGPVGETGISRAFDKFTVDNDPQMRYRFNQLCSMIVETDENIVRRTGICDPTIARSIISDLIFDLPVAKNV